MFSFRRSFPFRIAAPRAAVGSSQEFSLVGSAAPAWSLALGVRLQPPRSPRRKKLQHKIGPSNLRVCSKATMFTDRNQRREKRHLARKSARGSECQITSLKYRLFARLCLYFPGPCCKLLQSKCLLVERYRPSRFRCMRIGARCPEPHRLGRRSALLDVSRTRPPEA